jgi:hypothetical protein
VHFRALLHIPHVRDMTYDIAHLPPPAKTPAIEFISAADEPGPRAAISITASVTLRLTFS